MPNDIITDPEELRRILLSLAEYEGDQFYLFNREAGGPLDDEEPFLPERIKHLRDVGYVHAPNLKDTGMGVILAAPIEPTAAGRDWLRSDGGITAAQSIVRIEFADKEIRDLLIERIAKTDVPEEKKKTLVQHIKSLPQNALGELLKEVVKRGIDHAPDILNLL